MQPAIGLIPTAAPGIAGVSSSPAAPAIRRLSRQFAESLPDDIRQLSSRDYRNPDQLKEGCGHRCRCICNRSATGRRNIIDQATRSPWRQGNTSVCHVFTGARIFSGGCTQPVYSMKDWMISMTSTGPGACPPRNWWGHAVSTSGPECFDRAWHQTGRTLDGGQ